MAAGILIIVLAGGWFLIDTFLLSPNGQSPEATPVDGTRRDTPAQDGIDDSVPSPSAIDPDTPTSSDTGYPGGELYPSLPYDDMSQTDPMEERTSTPPFPGKAPGTVPCRGGGSWTAPTEAVLRKAVLKGASSRAPAARGSGEGGAGVGRVAVPPAAPHDRNGLLRAGRTENALRLKGMPVGFGSLSQEVPDGRCPLQHRFDGPRTAPWWCWSPPLGTKWSMWEPQMPELTRRLRVLRVNHRGHGSSPAPPGPYSMQELGGDLPTLLDECDLSRCRSSGSVGGDGGAVGGCHEPFLVSRLALVSTTAWAPLLPRWRDIGDRVRHFGISSVIDEVTRSWFTPGFCERRPDIVTRFTEEFEKISPKATPRCDAIAALDHRPLARLVHAPTVVIAGAHDPQTPPGHGRRLAALLPHARFEVVSGAAHLVNVERSDVVNELLLQHLDPLSVHWP